MKRRMSRIAKGPSDSLFKNKRLRTIAKGDGLGLRLVLQGKQSSLVSGLVRFAHVRRISSCETRLTLTPNIAAPSSERLAKGYGRHSKRIESCPRTLECNSNGSANQKAELSVRQKCRDQDTRHSAAVANRPAIGLFRKVRNT
jgi:hypothetical protein